MQTQANPSKRNKRLHPPLLWFLTPPFAIRLNLADVSVFFCLGRGKGESEAPGGRGGSIFIEIPGGGLQEGEGPMGREGVCGELGNWGGGAK